MTKARDLANGESRFVNAAGDAMTGDLTTTGSVGANTGGADGGLSMRPWTANAGYMSLATANMVSEEYALLTDGNNTYISTGSGGATHLRGGSNSATAEVQVTPSAVNVTGTMNAGTIYGGRIFAVSPASGSSGGFTLRQNAAGGTLYFQFVSNAASAQYGLISCDDVGNMSFGGTGTGGTASATDLNNSVRMLDVYNKTTTAAANMLIATVPLGYVYRSTASSARWKNSVEELSGYLDASRLLDLPVHQFKFNDDYLNEDDQRYGKYVPGFIAEEVAEIYPIAAELDEEGKPSDWNSRLLLPPMLKLIQDQAQKIEELEARINALEGN